MRDEKVFQLRWRLLAISGEAELRSTLLVQNHEGLFLVKHSEALRHLTDLGKSKRLFIILISILAFFFHIVLLLFLIFLLHLLNGRILLLRLGRL